MDHGSLDWEVLDRLRGTFLGGCGGAPYWRDERDLAQYDATFGERIGWKWDAVLGELGTLGWRPPAGAATLVDWGCGSGIAGRRVARAFGPFARAVVSDHSPAAMRFAAGRLRAEGSPADVAEAAPHSLVPSAGTVLVASHVLNELGAAPRAALLALARAADAVLWVEPGTRECGRGLQEIRAALLATHDVVAPCTHQDPCGLLAPGREGDWCHQFAPPPPGIHADADWARFAERAGIDLRALPYACLVLERRAEGTAPRAWDGRERLLGRPEVFKPEARVASCGPAGVSDAAIPRRTAPALYKACKRGELAGCVRWHRDARGWATDSTVAALPPRP